MDFKSIEELIKAVNNSDLYTLEIESEGTKIRMKKGPDQIIAAAEVKEEPKLKETEEVKSAVQEVKVDESKAVAPKTFEEDKNIFVVKSPIVGTFYASSSPDKDNFVKVGSKIKKGSILCIIEAMKLMNEIESEVQGEVIEVMVENESMVEFGQPMFKIRIDG